MSLAQRQAELARLFTSRAARAEAPAGLAGEIERFAGSLIAKRRLDVEKWLPLTAKALGPRFGPLLRETLAEPPPGSRADALALVARLRDERESGWIGELAAYEGEFVRAWAPGAFFALRRYRWPVGRIAEALAAGLEVSGRRAATWAVWARAPGGRLWRRWRSFGG